MRILILVIFVLMTSLLRAQPYPSTGGTFTVNQKKGCGPLTVSVTAPACAGSSCSICYGETSTCQTYTVGSTDQFTYNSPGVYNLRIVEGPNVDNIQIIVVENRQPDVEVSSCRNNEVLVKITDTKYDSYRINYNDGTVVTVGPGATNRHIYASSGAKTVSVHGVNVNAQDNCNPRVINVNALQTLTAPVISRIDALTDAVRIEYTGQPNIQYKLEIAINNATTFQQIRTLLNKSVDTVLNLKPDENYYCFRIGTFDPCLNQIIYSTTACSINLDAVAQNNQNVLTFVTNSVNTPGWQILKEITPGGAQTVFPVAGSPYNDTDVICGTEYCYQMVSTYPNGGQSFSLAKCVTAISTDKPDPLANVSAVVTEPGVQLQWLAPTDFTAAEYSIYKILDGKTSLVTNVAASPATDPSYISDSEACYKISYSDICNNTSDLSLEACPVRLTGKVIDNNDVELEWSAYKGWLAGVAEQHLEKYTVDGVLLETFVLGGAVTSFIDASTDPLIQVYRYRIVAYANDDAIPASVSNIVTVIKDPQLFYPTAFTPNGDNLNDVFNVYGQYISEFEMDIYNRWGELIFTTRQLDEGWDGRFKNVDMPEGTYTFVARITDLAGRDFKKSGSILLLKKK